ncbi:hypothetical protein BDN72DRAFT_865667 [Pluteus cervinus]|uniref:Uncharacterized protein n=1 Tax=Pluteus cervinus TaxID=181527 RepID=A0ACD2ZZF5_9AGAR|nr:hypothetical protein BDN72DRAFT_865667 [Pluteus cervinus]
MLIIACFFPPSLLLDLTGCSLGPCAFFYPSWHDSGSPKADHDSESRLPGPRSKWTSHRNTPGVGAGARQLLTTHVWHIKVHCASDYIGGRPGSLLSTRRHPVWGWVPVLNTTQGAFSSNDKSPARQCYYDVPAITSSSHQYKVDSVYSPLQCVQMRGKSPNRFCLGQRQRRCQLAIIVYVSGAFEFWSSTPLSYSKCLRDERTRTLYHDRTIYDDCPSVPRSTHRYVLSTTRGSVKEQTGGRKGDRDRTIENGVQPLCFTCRTKNPFSMIRPGIAFYIGPAWHDSRSPKTGIQFAGHDFESLLLDNWILHQDTAERPWTPDVPILHIKFNEKYSVLQITPVAFATITPGRKALYYPDVPLPERERYELVHGRLQGSPQAVDTEPQIELWQDGKISNRDRNRSGTREVPRVYYEEQNWPPIGPLCRSHLVDPLASVLSPERWDNPVLRGLMTEAPISPLRDRHSRTGIHASGRVPSHLESSSSELGSGSRMATSPDRLSSPPSMRPDPRTFGMAGAATAPHSVSAAAVTGKIPSPDSSRESSPLTSLSSTRGSPLAQVPQGPSLAQIHQINDTSQQDAGDPGYDSSPLSSPPSSNPGSPPSHFTSRSTSPTLVGSSRGVSRASSVTIGGSRSSSLALPKRRIAPLPKSRSVTQSALAAGGNGGGGGGGGNGGGHAVNIGWVDPNCKRNGVGGQVEQPAPLLNLNELYPIEEGGDNEILDGDDEQAAEELFWGGGGGGDGNSGYVGYEGEGQGDSQEHDHVDNEEPSSGTGQNWDALPGFEAPSVPEKQVLSLQSCSWISNIATICRQVLSQDASLSNPQIALDGFDAMFEALNPLSEDAKNVQGLNKLAFECYVLETTQAGTLFQYFMRTIIFRLALHNETIVKGVSFNKIYETMVIQGGPTMQKLGVKTLERLGLAGSRYCLLGARISSKSEMTRLNNIEAGRISTLFKSPHPVFSIFTTLRDVRPRKRSTFLCPTYSNWNPRIPVQS